jgi:putative phosphoribosyl transferase
MIFHHGARRLAQSHSGLEDKPSRAIDPCHCRSVCGGHIMARADLDALPGSAVNRLEDRTMIELADRTSAGEALAARLAGMGIEDPVVLALPRGGVPVGKAIADRLGAPLDLLLVRKVGVPWQPELAAAAVVDGDSPEIVLNEEVARLAGLSREELSELASRELREIERRRRSYCRDIEPEPVEGRTAILVDDGIATGTTARVALAALRRRRPKRLVLAVPVAPAETAAALAPLVDDLVCLDTPEMFGAISTFYVDFHQLSDEEVLRLLAKGSRSAEEG